MKKLITLIISVLSIQTTMSQVADIDVVWDKTHFGEGSILATHPTSNKDGYWASGGILMLTIKATGSQSQLEISTEQAEYEVDVQ